MDSSKMIGFAKPMGIKKKKKIIWMSSNIKVKENKIVIILLTSVYARIMNKRKCE